MKLCTTILISGVLAGALHLTVRADEKDKPRVVASDSYTPPILTKNAPSSAFEPAHAAQDPPNAPRSKPKLRTGNEKAYQIETKLFQGDTLGSMERHTLKCLASPTLCVLEGFDASFQAGGSQALPGGELVPVGHMLRFRVAPEPTNAERIRLVLTIVSTELVSSTDRSVHLQSQQSSFLESVKAGETIKLRLGRPSLDNQTWVEVKVQPVECVKDPLREGESRLSNVLHSLVKRNAAAPRDVQLEQAPYHEAAPVPALDETRLHGVWRGNEGEGCNCALFFGPNNAVRFLNQEGRELVGSYSIDWSKHPRHLDLKWGDQPIGRTIMEFTPAEKLRMELGRAVGDARPTTFSSDVLMLTKMPTAGSEQARAEASQDLRLAKFYQKAGRFALAYFYGELVKHGFPNTNFSAKAAQLLVEVNKHRVYHKDGTEGWQKPESGPQKPPAFIAPEALKRSLGSGIEFR